MVSSLFMTFCLSLSIKASLIHGITYSLFYCLNISLLKTLERYQRYIYASADAAVPSSDQMQVRGLSILLLLQTFIINIVHSSGLTKIVHSSDQIIPLFFIMCISHNSLVLLTLFKFWNYTYQVNSFFKYDQLSPTKYPSCKRSFSWVG
jgi:hypothetical protein